MSDNSPKINLSRLIGLAGKPWALNRATAEAWREILSAKLIQGTVEVTDFVAARAERSDKREWQQDGRLAIVPVVGTLIKRPSLFHSGSTYGKVRQMVAEALEDFSVKAIMLDIDSPGGGVDGITGLAGYLAQVAEIKPLYAFVDGQACSAAYWIATQAKEIAGPPEAEVGSIGVRTVHVDRSEQNQKFGFKVTHLAVGDYKVAGNQDEPLGDEAKSYIMSQLQELYDLFADAVSTNRGMDRQAVVDTQARVYLAAQAKKIGLIDEVMGREAFISRIKEELSMDLNTLKAEHEAVYKEAVAEATRGMIPQASADEQIAQAKKDEAARVLGLAGSMLDEKTASAITALVATGATPEQAAAMKAAFAPQAQAEPQPEGGEAAAKAKILDGIQAAASQPLAPAAGGQDQDFDALVSAHMKEAQCTKADAVRAVAKANPKAHEAWVAAKNK